MAANVSAASERRVAGESPPVALQLLEHGLVALRARHRRDVGEVLRGGAQQRGPADVDHLDRLLLGHAALRGDLGEGVEVDDDEVERLDRERLERGEVVLAVAPGEDAAVDPRVQRLHASAEHLRRARHVLDPRHREPEGLEHGGGAAGGDELAAQPGQPHRERLEAALVVTEISARTSVSHHLGKQLVLDGVDALLERVARLDRDRSLLQHGPGVDARVDEVDGHAGDLGAGGERVLDRARAGKRRQQRGMDVDDPLREAVEERVREQVHVAGADDQADAVGLEPGGHRGVALLAAPAQLEDRGRDPGRLGALERAHAGPVRRDGGDRQPLVDQRLQVRPLAGDEDADHSTRPITSRSPGSATTAQKPMPRLKTRRSSSSAT